MSDNFIPSNEIPNQGFTWGNIPAPPDFNPDAAGFAPPPPGKYLLRCIDVAIQRETKDVNVDGRKSYLRNMMLTYEVAEGEHRGKRVYDFVLIPTDEQPMTTFHANKWGHLAKRFGFDLRPGELIPRNLRSPHDFIGRLVMADVVKAIDFKTKQPKLDKNDNQMVSIADFGYSLASQQPPPAAQPQPPGQAAQSQESGGPGYDL